MPKVLSKNCGSGVSHLRKVAKRSVNIRFNADEVEKIERAAHESGRSIAGFVRYAALQMLSEMNKEDV